MMRKVYFRADASTQIGYGHFIRTLALADMLKDDFECVFFTAEPTEYQRAEVKRVCALEELPADESKFPLFLDRLKGDEIVFLDNYFFTPQYEKAVKEKGCKLIALAQRKTCHYADVIINYIDNERSHYSIDSSTQLVAGLEWSILREPFRRPVNHGKRLKDSIVVSFGGTDQYSLTEKVVDVLGTSKHFISVICTDRVSAERRVALKNKGVEVYTNISAEMVADIFECSEFAILSSSSVCLEALSRGSKVVAGYYVDNQVAFYRTLINGQYIIGLGDLLADKCFYSLDSKLTDASNKIDVTIDFTKQKELYTSLFKSIC